MISAKKMEKSYFPVHLLRLHLNTDKKNRDSNNDTNIAAYAKSNSKDPGIPANTFKYSSA